MNFLLESLINNLSEEEAKLIKTYHLLTAKPVIYVANLSTEQISNYADDKLFNELKNSLSEEEKIIPYFSTIRVWIISSWWNRSKWMT
nr:hypothetical protein [Mycoplasmopsis bovis]